MSVAAREDADIETASDDYAQRFAGSVGAWFLEVQASLTLELLRPWPGARVLDVGGGHAQLTGPLLAAGHRVTVHGSSPACARRLAPWLRRGETGFVAADVLSLPFAARAFDVVLCYRLLPHTTRVAALVAELCRVARSAVLVDYPTLRSVNLASGALFRWKQGVERNTRPFTVFQDRQISAAFGAAGFAARERRPEFLLPMALHRALRTAALSRTLEGLARASGLRWAFGSPVILRAEPRG
jgi:SAM-dependent methyltransferase